MSSGRSLESYVHQGDESVTVDTAQIIDPKQKQLSNSLCSIEAKKSSKVSVNSTTLIAPTPVWSDEENFPNALALDAAYPARLGLCCTNDGFIIS